MRIKRMIIMCIAFAILLPVSLSAISEAAMLWMLIEPSARSNGMANAYIAQVDDAFSTYWCTAALAYTDKTSLVFQHSNWLGGVKDIDDIYLEYLAASTYIPEIGNVGAFIHFLTTGEHIRTSEDSPNEVSKFKSWEVVFGGSWAYRVSRELAAGVNVKILYSHLSPEGTGETEQGKAGEGYSWAIDLSAKYTLQKNQQNYAPGTLPYYLNSFSFAWSLSNMGPDISYINEDQADPLPMNWRMGVSSRVLHDQFHTLVINMDVDKLLATRDDTVLETFINAWSDEDLQYELDSAIYHIGAEYKYLNMISLRGGYIRDKAGSMEGLSFGVGFEVNAKIMGPDDRLFVDYGLHHGGDLVNYNHILSIGLDF